MFLFKSCKKLFRVSPAYCRQVDYLKDGKGIRTMETFEGRYTVEPVYVDAERLCKHMKPKSPEEYRKCSGGKGLIASKVKVDQTFRPASPWDLPLLSSYMRLFTIETTKKVAEDLQIRTSIIRGIRNAPKSHYYKIRIASFLKLKFLYFHRTM